MKEHFKLTYFWVHVSYCNCVQLSAFRHFIAFMTLDKRVKANNDVHITLSYPSEALHCNLIIDYTLSAFTAPRVPELRIQNYSFNLNFAN